MRHLARNLALAGPTIALLALCATRTSSAYPADVFTAGSPLKGPAVHPRVEVPMGSWAVSPQTGAATYSFGIPVPPGRNGMAPQLALSYSSQNPLRGGIAAGWQFDVPSIEVDTSQGILEGRSYRSSIAGGQRLVPVVEPIPGGRDPEVAYFRVESGDSDFVRYEHHAFSATDVGFWKALHSNGNVFYFGRDPLARDDVQPDGSVREGRWMLTHVIDPVGNEIRYTYAKVPAQALNGSVVSDVDIRLETIEWGRNFGAGLESHAQVELNWDGVPPCLGSFVPIGAEFSYRNGIRTYKGAMRLDNIQVRSRTSSADPFVTRRTIDLQYDSSAEDCTKPRAPLRVLSGIAQTVWTASGAAEALPAVTFGYDPAGGSSLTRTLTRSPTDTIPAPLTEPTNLGQGARHLLATGAPPNPDYSVPGTQPSVLAMLTDANGDGFTDVLKLTDQTEQSCNVDTYLNTSGEFVAASTSSWQRRPWENVNGPNNTGRKEGCNLAYQIDRRTTPPVDPNSPCQSMSSNYNASHLIDLDGDAIPELITALDSKPGSYFRPNDLDMGPEPSCEGAEEAACLSAHDEPQRVACSIPPPTPWMFPTADNDPAPGEPGSCGCASGQCPAAWCFDEEGGCTSCWECFPCESTNSLSGDLFSSRAEVSESGTDVWVPTYRSWDIGQEQQSGVARSYNPTCRYYADSACLGRYWWHVSDFIPGDTSWGSPADVLSPVPLESSRGTATAGEGPTMSSFQALVDIDGDRCIDGLYVAPSYRPAGIYDQIQVFRGDCNGHFYGRPFPDGTPDPDGEPFLWPLPPNYREIAYSRAQPLPVVPNEPGEHERERVIETQRTLSDVNGDGLPDYVVGTATGLPPYDQSQRQAVQVFYNTGTGFESTPTVLSEGTGGANGVAYEDVVHTINSERSVILTSDSTSNNIAYGWSQATLRPFDFDGDGRFDIAQLTPPTYDYVDEETFNPWSPIDDPDRTVRLHVNVGDRFVPVAPTAETNQWWDGLAHITLSTPAKWWVKTDVQDFNGDGLPDMFGVHQGSVSSLCQGHPDGAPDFLGCETDTRIYRDERDGIGQGMRLLRRIENGRGAVVEFEYGSSADRTGADPLVVTNGGRMPLPVWLVRRMTVTPAPGAEPAVTDFRYAKPTFNPDRHGQWAFRGFGGVTTWEPMNESGARRRVHRRYSYLLDYSGRPFQTTVWEGDRLQTLEQTIWERGELFDGDVESFHPIITRRYTCRSGAGFGGGMAASSSSAGEAGMGSAGGDNDTPADVSEDPYAPEAGWWSGSGGVGGFETASGSGGMDASLLGGTLTEDDCIAYGLLERTTRRFVSRSATQLSYSDVDLTHDIPTNGGVHIVPEGSAPVLYVQRGERLTDTPHVANEPEAATEDRGWISGESILYSQDRYEILPTDNRKYRAMSSAWTDAELWGRSQTVYDGGGLGLPQATRVWHDDAEYAETTRTFDLATGNVLTVTAPSGLVTTTTYDSSKLFPATVTPLLFGPNPPNLTVAFTHDVHTGNVTRQEGPAQPGKPTLPVVETTYDGEGRVTQLRRSFDWQTWYVTDTAKTITYFDHLGDPLPHRVHVEELINQSQQTWIRRDTTIDGLGRPIAESVQLDSGVATTSYDYDPAGNLVSVALPSPTGTGTAEYSYDYDALGRVLLAEQPGTPGTWSFEYDGGRVIRTQNAPDGSAASQAILDSDAFGRLSFVTELRPGQTPSEAIWGYTYDPNDNMKGIVDADQIATAMTHDFVGHRKTVTRQDTAGTPRVWEYDYDLAGNLVSELMPFDGAFNIADFMSTWAYDELGRVTSHRTASRGMTSPEISRYFPGPSALFTYHTYDQSGHGSGIGRLTHVELPFGTIDYDYTVEGRVSNEERAFTVAPGGVPLSDTRSYNVTYNALGQPVRIRHADTNSQPGDAGAPTVTRTIYDARGLPLDVNRLVDVSGTTTTTLLARVTRNAAGVPIERYSAFDQGQAWAYDALGRVTSHGIRSCTAGPVAISVSRTCAQSGMTVGGETIAYYDSGDVESIQDPFTGKTITYSFDAQHQLVNAITTVGEPFYQADLSYTPAGRVRTARVTSSGPGVSQRDVRHEYAPADPPNDPPADPHAVRRLVDQTSQNTIGVLDYDPTGNLVGKTWTPSGAPANNQDHDFIYDGDNQLREAINHKQSGEVSEVYFYDHAGQRMLAYTSADGSTPARLRLWFGQTEIEYSVATSPIAPTKTDVFASLGAMPVARIHRGSITAPVNAEVNLLYSGVLGSLLTVVGTPPTPDPVNHALLARYSYGPFGELLASGEDDADQFHRLFNGKEHDQLTSLSYYGYRFYDRLTLTWTQADPLYRFVPDLAWDEPRRANLYSFSLNNPLRYIDPDGRDSCNGRPDCKWIEHGGSGKDRTRGAEKKKSGAGQEGEGSEGEVGDEAGGGSDDGVTGRRKFGRHNGGKKGGVKSGTVGGATEVPVVDFGEFGIIEAAIMGTPETAEEINGLGIVLSVVAPGLGAAKAGAKAVSRTVSEGADDAFEILDGVRRSKAAEIAGKGSIKAEVSGTGGKVVEVPLGSLRSPKSVIDVSSPRDMTRWMKTLGQTLRGSEPPPILVRPGPNGTPIHQVKVKP
jgi:RHS repeat-associated protein